MKKTILLGHGSGGLMTSELIREIFLTHFNNSILNTLSDSAILQISGTDLAFTTDSFVIDPLFFPGGDIGKLAVCGTVNDLSVSAARPLFLSAGFILEEGFPMEDLERITKSMADEALHAGVRIVTGDTKVVKRGQCDKLYINTSGIGLIDRRFVSIAGGSLIQPGDQVVVNGYLGDHEMAVLAARENLGFENAVFSDVASLNNMIMSLLEAGVKIRFMRDITRGGLATVLSEIAVSAKVGIRISESLIPIREQISGICEVYGFNPLYLANEGKVVMIVAKESASQAVKLMKKTETGTHACIIGEIGNSSPGRVLMNSRTSVDDVVLT